MEGRESADPLENMPESGRVVRAAAPPLFSRVQGSGWLEVICLIGFSFLSENSFGRWFWGSQDDRAVLSLGGFVPRALQDLHVGGLTRAASRIPSPGRKGTQIRGPYVKCEAFQIGQVSDFFEKLKTSNKSERAPGPSRG